MKRSALRDKNTYKPHRFLNNQYSRLFLECGRDATTKMRLFAYAQYGQDIGRAGCNAYVDKQFARDVQECMMDQFMNPNSSYYKNHYHGKYSPEEAIERFEQMIPVTFSREYAGDYIGEDDFSRWHEEQDEIDESYREAAGE